MSNEITTVQPKSTVIAMLLSFFLCAGGFYVAGAKKGALLFLGCWILSLLLMQVSSAIMVISNIVCCFVTYQWLKEYNNAAAA